MLSVARNRDFWAQPERGLLVASIDGKSYRWSTSDALSVKTTPTHAVALYRDGRVVRHAAKTETLWQLARVEGEVFAIDATASIVFASGFIIERSGARRELSSAVDFHEAWIFAAFLRNGELGLGYETSQPYSEYGSYGSPHEVVEVCDVRSSDSLRFVERGDRWRDRVFDLRAIAYAPSGLCAFATNEEVYVLENKRPPTALSAYDRLYSDTFSRSWNPMGDCSALDLALDGKWLVARFVDRTQVLDLANNLTAEIQLPNDAFELHGSVLRWLDDSFELQETALEELVFEDADSYP